MKMFGRWSVLVLAAILVAVYANVACADLYWESVSETKNIPQQPDTSSLVKTYYSLNASRIETDDFTMIIDHDAMMLYRLNPKDKTYTTANMGAMVQGPAGEAPAQVEQRKKFQQMMASMVNSMEVTPTDEKKSIAGYPCRKVLVKMMMMESDYWVSKDVEGYDELKAISAHVAEKFKDNPMLAQMTQAAMLSKLDGFPVQVVSHMGEGATVTTLKGIEKKPLSADLFKVPADYKLRQR